VPNFAGKVTRVAGAINAYADAAEKVATNDTAAAAAVGKAVLAAF
jgi:hypothetical protein